VVAIMGGTALRSFFDRLSRCLALAGRSDVAVVECHAVEESGSLTLLTAGTDEALQRAEDVLRDGSDKLLAFPGNPGNASKAYTVYRLLLGSHIAAAAEAIGLAARAGLNTQQVYDIITNAAGSSRAFESRVPSMLEGDWSVKSSSLDACVRHMAP